MELILQLAFLIQVSSKASPLFSGVLGYEVHENILSPESPYATAEQGSQYLKLKSPNLELLA